MSSETLFHFAGKLSSCFTSTFAFFLKTKLIEEEIVIFVCATTGQGDEPDNMKVSGKAFFLSSSCISLFRVSL